MSASMSHVSVTIHGRQYRMACEDGQEAHLLRLAQELEARIQDLRSRFGEIGDMRLTVMAALTVTDELVEANKRRDQREQELSELREGRSAAVERSRATKTAVAAALLSAAERIERLTKRLNSGRGDGE